MASKSSTIPWSPASPSQQASPLSSAPGLTASRIAAYLLGGTALATFVILRLWDLTRYDLNGGETFLIDGVRMTWAGMMRYVVADMVHPPLPYFLLRGWMAVGGDSLLWLKLFTAVPAIATLVPFLLICRELRLRAREVNLALMLAAVNAYLIHHAQDARMYSLFLFLAMCSAWIFLRYIRASRSDSWHLIALAGANILLVYTHYFGWLLVASQFVVLLIWDRRRLRGFLGATTGVALVFLPWAAVVVRQWLETGSTIGWIPRPRLRDVGELYGNLNGLRLWPGSPKLGLLLFGIPLLSWVVQLARGRAAVPVEARPSFWFLVVTSLGTVGAVFVASWVLPDAFWFERYFIFMSMIYMILVAVAVSRVGSEVVSRTLIAAVLAWALAAGANDIRTARFASEAIGSRVQWAEVAQRFAQTADLEVRTDDAVVYAIPVAIGGRLTGNWAFTTSMSYHLNELGYSGYVFRYAETLGWVTEGNPPDEYWVATYDLGDLPQATVRERLTRAGHQVVHEITSSAGRHELVLLKVRRPENTTSRPPDDGGEPRPPHPRG